MFALFFSSILSGLIATAVMVVFLYLPRLWNGVYYDTLGGLGAMFLGQANSQARLIGAVLIFAGGVLFGFFYGWFALMFLNGTFLAPQYLIFAGTPLQTDLFFVILGLVGGFGQGMFVSLITTFIATDFHPLESYRDPFPLILSFLIGHTVYGAVVMLLQYQFLKSVF